MKYIGKIDDEEFVFDAPFDLEEGEQVQFIKQLGPPPEYPPEPNKPKEFVVQCHWRGRTTHGDYRVLRTSKEGEGWTLLFQQPGAPPVPDLVTAKTACSRQELFKISLKTGNILSREVITTIHGEKRTITRPGAIRAEMKAEEIPSMWVRLEGHTPLPPLWPETVVENWNKFWPITRNELRKEGWPLARCRKIIERPEWKQWRKTFDEKYLKPLGIELSPTVPVGATKSWPGVFYILDHGLVTYGVRKPWVFEYFFEKSDLFHGRFLFRLVEHSVSKAEIVLPVGEKEVRPRGGTYWILMTPTEPGQLVQPYILGSSAAEKNIILPYGVAALPQEFQKAIADEYKYWKVKDEKKRGEILDALRESWDGKSLESLKPVKKHIIGADNQFKLLYRSWRGQHVIRFGPSTREYILLFSKTRKAIALMNDPVKRKTVAGYNEDLPFEKLWRVSSEEEVPPNSTLNPTKDTPCTIRKIDEGTYKVPDEGEGFFKVDFSGDQLKGLYFFREEEPGAGIWEVTQSSGPQVKKDALLKGRFVLQRHELPLELGQSHWDIRIQPENWDQLIEWNVWDAEPAKVSSFTGIGKSCNDLSWIEIKQPTTKDVDGYPTKVIPVDSGEVELGVSTGVDSPGALLSEKQIGVIFKGKKLEGIWQVKHDDDTWKFIKEHDVRITKADKKKQLVYGVVLAPFEVDSWLDYERPEEIEKAAHIYLIRMWEGQKPAMVGKEHKEPIEAIPVESYIAPVDFWYPGTPQTEAYRVKAGSWVLVTYIKDKAEFNKVLEGKYKGYSVQGLGRRRKVSPNVRNQLD